MLRGWAWLLISCCCFAAMGNAMSTSLMEDVKKADQALRPKPAKRAQETLLFGNQQNRQAAGGESSGNSYSSAAVAEKRTLSSSGLNGLKNALGEDDEYSRAKAAVAGDSLYERESASPYARNYEYGKVLVNELNDEEPSVWDVPPYSRYYANEERRKRSEKSAGTSRTTVSPPTAASAAPTSSFQVPVATQSPTHQVQQQHQLKRSVPIYTEPRYKRELDIDPEDVLALLSLWENERRNRNWRKYANEEYDNVDDDSSMMEDEDPRNAIPWGELPVYPTHRYGAESLSPSEIGIVRTYPPSYYDQYADNGVRYGSARYNAAAYQPPPPPLPQHAYYPQEKRFMVTRKRSSQAYEPYTSPVQLQLGSQSPARGYPDYQRRMVY